MENRYNKFENDSDDEKKDYKNIVDFTLCQ